MPANQGTATGNYYSKNKGKKKSKGLKNSTSMVLGGYKKPKPAKHKGQDAGQFIIDYAGGKNNSNVGTWGKPKKKKKGGSLNFSGTKGGTQGGSSGSSGSSGSGSSGGRGRARGKRGGKKKGKGGSPPGVNRKEAASLVQADVNTQLLALANQARAQRRARDYSNSQANALFGRTKGDLNYLFNEARDYTGAKNAQIDDRFNNTKNDIAGLAAQFEGEQAVQVEARKAAAAAELQRLGIQQSGLGSFDADAQASQNASSLANQNNQANLSTMAAGASEIGNLLLGMATGSEASGVGQATTTKNNTISQNNMDFNQFMGTILGKSQDINSQKFLKTNDLAQQLQQQRFTQFMQMRAAGMNPGGGKKAKARARQAQSRILKSFAAQSRRGNQLMGVLGGIH